MELRSRFLLSEAAYTTVSVLFFGMLFWGLTTFEMERNAVAICFAVSLLLLRYQSKFSNLARYMTWGLSIFLVSALWSFRLEGKYFGEGFWAHLGTGNFLYLLVYKKCVIYSICFYVFSILLLLRSKKKGASTKWIWGAAGIFIILGPLATTVNSVRLFASKGYFSSKVEFDGKSPIEGGEYFFKGNLPKYSVKAKKNIIFVVMEGIEAEYLNQEKFPGLMPNLSSLKKEGYSFSNFKQGPGGYTTGGLLASLCGVFITALSDEVVGNDILLTVPTMRLNCLGDLLENVGWKSYFYQGTDLRFSNLGRLFSDHHTKMFGVERFEPQQLHAAGAYDFYLFEKVKKLVTDVGDQGPFFLSFINYDSHGPGFQGPKCQSYHTDNDVAKGVHCYDQYLGDFINFLKSSPIWKDTVVFIFNDHLSMMNFQDIDFAQRRNFMLILNSGYQGESNLPLLHIDIPKIASNLVLNENKSFPMSSDLLNSQSGKKSEFDDQFMRKLVDFMGRNLK